MKRFAARIRCGKVLLALAVCSLSAAMALTPVHASSESGGYQAGHMNLPQSESGEYIVKLRDGATPKKTKLRAMSSAATLADSTDQHLLIRVRKGTDDSVLQSLASDPEVEYIEPNIRMYAASAVEDPYYSEQWGLEQIQASEAWEAASGRDASTGSGEHTVTVAVIDTGVDYTHPDLKGRVDTVHDYDYVNGDSDARDDEGHGTHVAGIIAARRDTQGIAGVSGTSPVKILPLKVLDSKGEGDLYDVASAIMDAADLGAAVINLSLGAELESGQRAPQTLTDAVQYALRKGALVVAAAGNEGTDADRFVPASIPGVVTVSATDEDQTLAAFSNYGSSVDLAAPGVDILSTYPGGKYAYGSGTSQATPFVSGVAVLLKASEPDLGVEELTDRLLSTATDLGKAGKDSLYGYGLVNAYRAVQTNPFGNAEPVKTVSSVKLDKNSLSLAPGGRAKLQLTASFSDGGKSAVAAADVVWKTKDQKVAVVEAGVVTATGFGKTSITATYAGKTATLPVDISVSRLAASRTTLTLKPDGNATVQLTATYGDQSSKQVAAADVEWKSQDEDIATVQDGVVTGHDTGNTYVTAAYGGKTVKIRVNVTMTKLTASPSKFLLKPGESAPVDIVAVYGEDGQVVTPAVEWRTGNADVAVFRDGQIVATGFGSTTLSASYRGKTVRISVDTRLKQLQADRTRLTLAAGEASTPALKATYSNGTSERVEDGMLWTSSNEKVATVDDDGEIVAIAKGTATVTAQYGGKSVRISVTVTS